MRRLAALLISGAVVLAAAGLAADAVSPQSCSFTNLRDEAQERIGDTDFFEATSLLFTNCVVYSGSSTSAAVQGLDEVEVEVRIGTTESSTAYTGTVDEAASGSWYCTVTVPTNLASAYVQVKVTDTNSNSYIYPWKTMYITDPLD